MSTEYERCTGETNKGTQCKNKATVDGFCKVHHPDIETHNGKVFSAEQREAFYNQWLQLMIQRRGLRDIAKACGVNFNTLWNHRESFKEWMRDARPDHYDPQIAVASALEESDDRIQLLLSQLADDKTRSDARLVATILREAREETKMRITLLQDLGIVAREQQTAVPDRIEILWPETPKQEKSPGTSKK